MEEQQAKRSDVIANGAASGSSGGEVRSKTNLVYYDEIAASQSSLRKPSEDKWVHTNRDSMVFRSN